MVCTCRCQLSGLFVMLQYSRVQIGFVLNVCQSRQSGVMLTVKCSCITRKIAWTHALPLALWKKQAVDLNEIILNTATQTLQRSPDFQMLLTAEEYVNCLQCEEPTCLSVWLSALFGDKAAKRVSEFECCMRRGCYWGHCTIQWDSSLTRGEEEKEGKQNKDAALAIPFWQELYFFYNWGIRGCDFC